MHDGEEFNDDEDFLEMALEHIRQRNVYVTRNNVDYFDKSRECESKKETLNDIRLELMHGFQERRTRFTEPTEEEELYDLRVE